MTPWESEKLQQEESSAFIRKVSVPCFFPNSYTLLSLFCFFLYAPPKHSPVLWRAPAQTKWCLFSPCTAAVFWVWFYIPVYLFHICVCLTLTHAASTSGLDWFNRGKERETKMISPSLLTANFPFAFLKFPGKGAFLSCWIQNCGAPIASRFGT